MTTAWQETYAEKLFSAEAALAQIQNGQTVYIGSGVGEPHLLTQTLAEMASRFLNVGLIHLTSIDGKSDLANPKFSGNFRYNTFYTGRGVSEAVSSGAADYTPIDISELPTAMRSGIVVIDIALIQISPPNETGICNLGLSVDLTKAAIESAKIVIGQVNRNLPESLGDTGVAVDDIDLLVEGDLPLIEVRPPEVDPLSLTIGRHISSLIEDGMTLHFDRSSISAAAMRYLDTKKDLGIHTDILTDDIFRLCKSRAVTNARKTIFKDKTIATTVMGSKELYAALDKNPDFALLPVDQVHDPVVIGTNDNMVSIHSIEEIELTGLARASAQGLSYSHNLPSSMDFILGSSRSKNGFSILAMPSTTPDGTKSRIVAHSVSRGVAFSRPKVNYVVTEYGVVNLWGRSIRERTVALISIAHPKFRQQLLDEAKQLGYVGREQIIAPESGCVYPKHDEFEHVLSDGTRIFFRPIRHTDARRLQRMFYEMSPQARRFRYHGTVKVLSDQTAQQLAAIDYNKDMAIVGVVGPPANPRIIAEARYMYNPHNNMGEFDIVVLDEFHGRGIGTFLANHLSKSAYSRGLSGLYAEVLERNVATLKMLKRAWPTAERRYESGNYILTVSFPDEDVARPKDSIIVYSGRFADYAHQETRHFRPQHARAALQLITEHGYLKEPWMRLEEPRMITANRLVESHSPGLIEALQLANDGEHRKLFAKFNLGGQDSPLFAGLFDYIMLYCSATLTAVDLIIEENANVVFNPLGGFSHSSRSRCERLCYVNDVIAAIDCFLSKSLKVAYVDLDAHHANGVQQAYYHDDRVLFISLHEKGKMIGSSTGLEDETGEARGSGFNINIPLPAGTDDEAYEQIFEKIALAALQRFSPSVIVMVIGTDGHKSDAASQLILTNNSMANITKLVRECSTQLLLLGGGGSDMTSAVNGWCRMWAAANRIHSLPDYMLVMGGSFLGGEGVAGAEIVDMHYRCSGSKKSLLLQELNRVADFHINHTLPLIGTRSE